MRIRRTKSAYAFSLSLATALASIAMSGSAMAQDTSSKQTQPNQNQNAPAPDSVEATTTTGQPTPAAQNTDPDASTVEDIVVTAQFRKQSLQDTPLAITAVDSALLEQRSQTDISQVADQAPNVTLTPGGASFGPSLGASIRGVGQFDFNPALAPGVGLYIDDVYYATLTGSVFDLLDLDRVEILRGPQGTLTGRNSEGGAIKLFTRKPDGTESGYVEGTYGSRNRLGLRGSADFALTDNLFGRVAGVLKHQEGFVDQIDYGCDNPGNSQGIPAYQPVGNCRVDKLGETSYQGLRGQLRYNPSTVLDWNVSADYTHEDRTNAPEVLVFSPDSDYLCGKFCTYADYRTPAVGDTQATLASNHNTFKGWGISSNAQISFSDTLTLTAITAYREYQATFGTDDDFTPDPNIAANGDNRLDFNFFSQELRLNGQLGDNIDFTLGGFYSDQKSVYYTRQDIRYIVPGVPFQFVGNDPINADSEAVYGTLIGHPTDALTITAGLRYTKESKDYTFSRRDYDGSPSTALGGLLAPLDGLTSTYDGDRVDYRLSADYRFSPVVLAYATFSTGFKGGGVSPRPFTAAQTLNGSFQPETLTNYEIGAKTNLFNRRLRLNVAGFIDEYKDIQTPIANCGAFEDPPLAPGVQDPNPCGVITNAGDAEFYGVEAEVDAEPIDNLNIDGSVSYLHSEYKSLVPAVGNNITLDDPATPSPNWKWSAGIQYKFDLNNAGSVTPRFDIAYNGEMFAGRAINSTPYYLDDYVVGNARLTWRNADSDLSVSLEVTNLFDEYYYISSFNAVYASTGSAYNQIGHPREWALTLKKDF